MAGQLQAASPTTKNARRNDADRGAPGAPARSRAELHLCGNSNAWPADGPGRGCRIFSTCQEYLVPEKDRHRAGRQGNERSAAALRLILNLPCLSTGVAVHTASESGVPGPWLGIGLPASVEAASCARAWYCPPMWPRVARPCSPNRGIAGWCSSFAAAAQGSAATGWTRAALRHRAGGRRSRVHPPCAHARPGGPRLQRNPNVIANYRQGGVQFTRPVVGWEYMRGTRQPPHPPND